MINATKVAHPPLDLVIDVASLITVSSRSTGGGGASVPKNSASGPLDNERRMCGGRSATGISGRARSGANSTGGDGCACMHVGTREEPGRERESRRSEKHMNAG